MKKFSKEKLHLPKIDGITLRWLINIIGVIVVFFIIVFIISLNCEKFIFPRIFVLLNIPLICQLFQRKS